MTREVRILLVIFGAAMLLGAGVRAAHGAPAGQVMMTRTAAWASLELGYPLPAPPSRPALEDELPDEVLGLAYGDEIVLDRLVSYELELIGKRGWSPGVWALPEDAAHAALHETLHYACPGCAGELEEAVVDAVALDLIAPWMHRFVGARPQRARMAGRPQRAKAGRPQRARWVVRPGYPEGVAAVRWASARATRSSSWRTRSARLWRRALLLAGPEGRAAMLAAVGPRLEER